MNDPNPGHAFDPSSGVLPDALTPELFVGTGEGTVTLLIATPLAEEGGWAPSAAVEIARSWGDAGHRIFLADLSLLRPVLHEILQDEVGQGMGDVLRGDATLDKVVHLAKAGSFLFAGAGEGVEDAEAALSSEGWTEVLEGLAEAEASAILYAPSDIPGLEALLVHATHVVALTGAGESLRSIPAAVASRVEVSLQPSFEGLDFENIGIFSGEGAEVSGVDLQGTGDFVDLVLEDSTGALFGEPQFSDLHHLPGEDPLDTEAEASIDEVGDLVDANGAAPEGLSEEAVASEEEHPPEEEAGVSPEVDDVPSPRPALEIVGDGVVGTPAASDGVAARHGRSLAVIGTIAIAFAIWVVLRGGESPALVEPEPVAEVSPEPALPLPPTPVGPVAAYSWAIGSFSNPGTARRLAATLADQAGGVQFIVVPIEVNGALFYRLLADPAEDVVAAQGLRDALASALSSLDSDAWVLRETPQGFVFGDFPTLAEAAESIAALQALEVDGYALELEFGSGHVYRVYAGAFADAQQARALAGIIEAAGLGGVQLQPRVGRFRREGSQ